MRHAVMQKRHIQKSGFDVQSLFNVYCSIGLIFILITQKNLRQANTKND
jgi:hypothetical protein